MYEYLKYVIQHGVFFLINFKNCPIYRIYDNDTEIIRLNYRKYQNRKLLLSG